MRINAGYTITSSILVGETEFVMGENNADPSPFATWECKGGSSYYRGRYMMDRREALHDLLKRAGQHLEFLKHRQGSSSQKKPKEAEAQ